MPTATQSLTSSAFHCFHFYLPTYQKVLIGWTDKSNFVEGGGGFFQFYSTIFELGKSLDGGEAWVKEHHRLHAFSPLFRFLSVGVSSNNECNTAVGMHSQL
jgi:hypothetical protein